MTVRFDLDRNETWRYERREMAAAIAAYTWSVMLNTDLNNNAYFAMHDSVLSVDNDLTRRRDHKGRHHGRGFLSEQRRGAIVCRSRDIWKR